MSDRERWVNAESEESFQANFYPTREAAIEEGLATFGGHAFFIARACAPDTSRWMPDAISIIEGIQESAYEDHGECTEDFLDAGQKDLDALTAILGIVIRGWMECNGYMPTFFGVEAVELIPHSAKATERTEDRKASQ